MKKKIEEKKVNNKNSGMIFIICGIVLLVLVIIIGIFMFIGGSKEDKLNKSLEKMGKDFYENYYYDQVGSTDEERATFVSEYETIGIKINLENLSRQNDTNKKLAEEFVNDKTNKKCDTSNTKVTIYPQKPYGKTDYKIETILDCGFEK